MRHGPVRPHVGPVVPPACSAKRIENKAEETAWGRTASAREGAHSRAKQGASEHAEARAGMAVRGGTG
jgi:hypothetical protein